jgi:methionyl-tRNA formyltransferase
VAEGHGAPGTVLAAEGALRIACAEGSIEVLTLQREGKKAMPAPDFLRGSPLAPGTVAP